VTLLAIAAGSAMLIRAQSALAGPGALADGSTLLSNGWRLAPVGRQVQVGDLPLNLAPTPDGKFVVVTNNGLARPSFSMIDANNWTVKSTTQVDNAWYGLVWHPDGTKMYSSGANQNAVQEYAYADGTLTLARTIALPKENANDTFTGGLAISADGRTLFATRVFSMSVTSIDVASGRVLKSVSLPAEPYTCVLSPDGRRLFVSIWGGAMVMVLDAETFNTVAYLPTGEHPNALALSQDGKRLFVACASSAEVWVFNTQVYTPLEQISMSLFPEAPPTSTPNSLAISPDGQTLLVSLADNNAVAMVDITNSVRSIVQGFIPTGWYPTGAVFSRDGGQLFISSGRGLASAPNLGNVGLEKRLLGSVASLPKPDRSTLAEYTRRVYSVTPYSDATRLSPPNVPLGSPIPRVVGAVSPIKYVFYVIRENRTYDQVLGDLAQGNGEPRFALFGKDITPNAHAIAQSFVLFDNFYVDAEVSYNGHAFSTAAYATDFIEKMWQTGYGGRGGLFLAEGDGFMRNPFGNITAPLHGYIWDYATQAGVSVRSYGEFVDNTAKNASGDVTTAASVPGLVGLVAPRYAGWDLDIKDQKRIDVWLDEFNAYVANRNLPRLSIIRLANDHTSGTRAGTPTPRAMVADNDLALGRLVEAISASPYWKESAIFVLEDDAQSGPDHVDSHRSVLLLASPFAKRAAVDHTFYSTSSVLRTIELILGLPPMSQYDAAATPLWPAFDSSTNMGQYRRTMPAVSLDEQNLATAFGATTSARMDFSGADRTDEILLNEIIWRSINGAGSAMPPPRRSVFVQPSNGVKDDD
jgi:DNA-binding beta-propeller fold protein YncE